MGGLQTLIGSGPDFLPTRVSYKLNLRGPSVNVQTACSTSLVAVHQACRSLLDRECDMALAGGVSVGAPVLRGYLSLEGGILSPDGHCRAFDAAARGTVPGHGVGIVVLRAAGRCDGRRRHHPRGHPRHRDQQRRVGEGRLHRAERRRTGGGHRAGARGGGCRRGSDQLHRGARHRHVARRPDRDRRADAACSAPGAANRPAPSARSRSNVGHLDAAAGVASLIKAVAGAVASRAAAEPALRHRRTREIDFARTPFYVNAAPDAVAIGRSAARRRQLVRHRRHQRARRPRRGAGVGAVGTGLAAGSCWCSRHERRARSRRRRNDWPGISRRTRRRRCADVAYTLQTGRRALAASARRRRVDGRRSAHGTGAGRQTRRRSPACASRAIDRACSCSAARAPSTPGWRASSTATSRPSARTSTLLRRAAPLLGWDLRAFLTATPTPDAAAR